MQDDATSVRLRQHPSGPPPPDPSTGRHDLHLDRLDWHGLDWRGLYQLSIQFFVGLPHFFRRRVDVLFASAVDSAQGDGEWNLVVARKGTGMVTAAAVHAALPDGARHVQGGSRRIVLSA
eukprot:scaffold3307_cov265-Pinguiococcus_pyrenoidosus.AAC.6